MYRIGVDLGGTKIAVGLVDEHGYITKKELISTDRSRDYEKIIKDLALLVKKIIKESGLKSEGIESIGIGIPGVYNSEKGEIIFAPNIGFTDVPIIKEMSKYINVPCFVGNDANCAALAESTFGAAKDVRYSMTITLGTGIGCGIVFDNKIYNGFNFAAGEVGHMVIVADGNQCNCGRHGCWETYASSNALTKQAIDTIKSEKNSLINNIVNGDLSKINARIILDAVNQNDEIALKIFNKYIKYLAEGITNIINIFEPEMIVIGGGISYQGDKLIKPLTKTVYENVYSKELPKTQIRAAKLGNDAGIIGAAMLS